MARAEDAMKDALQRELHSSHPADAETAAAIVERLARDDWLIVERDLLETLIDDGDCRFDHHGGCQTHGYLTLDQGEKCPQFELKELLA